MVPGAGLEPARTLPGPRDFKSVTYYLQQTLPGRKALYQRDFTRSYSVFLLLTAQWFSYSVSYSTATACALEDEQATFVPVFQLLLDSNATNLRRFTLVQHRYYVFSFNALNRMVPEKNSTIFNRDLMNFTSTEHFELSNPVVPQRDSADFFHSRRCTELHKPTHYQGKFGSQEAEKLDMKNRIQSQSQAKPFQTQNSHGVSHHSRCGSEIINPVECSKWSNINAFFCTVAVL
jgi:hypothetical protein